jgi:hypothetical protein
VRDLARKPAFWKPLRGYGNVWDFLDREDIGPLPEWVVMGAKLETVNGLIAFINGIDTCGGEIGRVHLSWSDPNAPQGPTAWQIDVFLEYWRPAVE